MSGVLETPQAGLRVEVEGVERIDDLLEQIEEHRALTRRRILDAVCIRVAGMRGAGRRRSTGRAEK